MELSLVNKLRIAAVFAAGVILIGYMAWPIAAPSDPLAPVRAGHLGVSGGFILLALACVTGFLAYFLSWPHGRHIGILAVPAGLSVWALRSGDITTAIQLNAPLAQRQALLASLRWEPLFWLAVVAAGYGGVLAARWLRPAPTISLQSDKPSGRLHPYAAAALSLAISVLVCVFGLRVLARDLSITHNAASTQPAAGQIVFAVLCTFGLAAFVVRKFIGTGYVYPIVGAQIVTFLSLGIYLRSNILNHFVQSYPAAFFPEVPACIPPLHMVAFGTLGSVAGYWMAFRYDYWRRHES